MVLLEITAVALIIPIVNTVIRPTPPQIACAESAISRGWGKVPILVTRALPYLTLYTQAIILVSLYFPAHPLPLLVAQTFSWSVFFLYHGMNMVNPMLLANHSEELVRKVIRLFPPLHPLFAAVWTGLHFQHSLFPFYLKYHQWSEGIVFGNHLVLEDGLVVSVMFALAYLCWHEACYHVQGQPAYPFIAILRERGLEMAFDLVGFLLFFIVYLLVWFF